MIFINKITIGPVRETFLKLMRIQKFGKFYKYSPRSLEILEVIDANCDFLTESFYNLPDGFLFNRHDEFIGFSSPILYGYYSLAQHLHIRYPLDKDKIVATLIKVLTELENIGLIYYDIHPFNIMLGIEDDFKLVDLDGAKLIANILYKKHMLYNFWETIFQMYVLPARKDFFSIIGSIWEREELKSYFSQEFLAYMKDIILGIPEVQGIPLDTYLDEVRDEEKMLRLRNEIDDRYYYNRKN